jgi:hypothetical protein
MRHTLFAGLSLGLLLAAVPAPAAARSWSGTGPRVWDETWVVTTRPSVRVVTNDAHVRVHAGAAGKVTAHLTYELKHWGLVFGANEPSVVFEHKGDDIWITARAPKGIGVIGGVYENFTIDVTLPPQVTLSVRTTDGAVDCEPLEGTFTFETGDGAVRAHGLKGEFEVSTGDGRVVFDEMDGRLRARTGDGHVTVAGRFDALDLRTGDVRVDARAGAGSTMGQAWNVQTGDGAVTLRMPHDIAALLDVRTRGGHIHLELPITVPNERTARHQIVGELNGGGPPIRIRTGDGGITLGLSD